MLLKMSLNTITLPPHPHPPIIPNSYFFTISTTYKHVNDFKTVFFISLYFHLFHKNDYRCAIWRYIVETCTIWENAALCEMHMHYMYIIPNVQIALLINDDGADEQQPWHQLTDILICRFTSVGDTEIIYICILH